MDLCISFVHIKIGTGWNPKMKIGLQEPNNGQMVTRQSVQGAQTSNSRRGTERFGNSKVSMFGGPASVSRADRISSLLQTSN